MYEYDTKAKALGKILEDNRFSISRPKEDQCIRTSPAIGGKVFRVKNAARPSLCARSSSEFEMIRALAAFKARGLRFQPCPRPTAHRRIKTCSILETGI